MGVSDRSRIPPRSVGGESPAARTVREALGAIASVDVVVTILRDALELAQAAAIPEGGANLRRFVAHSLDPATRAVLGDAAAVELLAQLAPIVARIPSASPAPPRRRRTTDRGAAFARAAEPGPTPPQSVERRKGPLPDARRVVLATVDTELAEAIRICLDGHEVVMVEDVVALLDAAQLPRSLPPVLVIDVGAASVQPSTLVTVSPDLLPGSTIVLWRAGRAVAERLAIFGSATDGWLRYEPGEELEVLSSAVTAT